MPENIEHSVIVIDDSPQFRVLLTKYLKIFGYKNILTAENGAIGVKLVLENSVNIIYIDGMMPEMDGATAIREIRKSLPNCVIIVVTSISSKELVLEFKEAGADFYILKPFEPDKLKETNEKAIKLFNERNQK